MVSYRQRIGLLLVALLSLGSPSLLWAATATDIRYEIPRSLKRIARGVELVCRVDSGVPQPELRRVRRGTHVALTRTGIRRRLRAAQRRLASAGVLASSEMRLRYRWQRFLLKQDRRCDAETVQTVCASELFAPGAALSFAEHPTFGIVPVALRRTGAGVGEPAFTFTPRPLWRAVSGAEELFPSELTQYSCEGLGEAGAAGSRLRWRGHPASGAAGVEVWLEVRPSTSEASFSFLGGLEVSGASETPIERLDLPQLYIGGLSESARLLKGVNVGVAIRDPLTHAYLHGSGGVALGIPDPLFPETQTIGVDATVHGGHALALGMGSGATRYSLAHFRSGRFDESQLLMSIGRRIDDADRPRSGALGESVVALLDCPRRDSCADELGSWYRKLAEPTLGPRGLQRAAPGSLDRALGLYVLLGADRGGTRSDFNSHLGYIERLREELGVQPQQTGLNIFDWTGRSFDAGTPGYIESPPDPLLPEFVRELKRRGYGAIAGYTRMAQWDSTLPSYSALNLPETGAVIRRDGSIDVNLQQIVTVDPAAPTVRRHFVDIIGTQLTDPSGVTGGFNSFFLDAFPLAVPCYATNHGHAVGGAHSFWPAAHGLIDELRTNLEVQTGESFLISEAGSEALVGHASILNFYHGLIPFGIPLEATELVDLIGAFKHHTPIGHISLIDIPGDDFLFFYPWAKESARIGDSFWVNYILDNHRLDLLWMFVNGRVNSIVRRPLADPFDQTESLLDDPYFGELKQILRASLAMLEHPSLRQYLYEGQIVPGLAIESPGTTEVVLGPRLVPRVSSGAMASVLGRIHQSNLDSSFAVAVANWRPTAEIVTIEIDLAAGALATPTAAERFSASLVDSSVLREPISFELLGGGESGRLRLRMALPPFTPVVLRFFS